MSGGLDHVYPVTEDLPGFPDAGKGLTVPDDLDYPASERGQYLFCRDGRPSSLDCGGKTECPSGECGEYQNENRQRNRYPIHVSCLLEWL